MLHTKAAPGLFARRRGKFVLRARRALLLAAWGAVGGAPAALAGSWDPVAGNGTVDGGGGAWDLLTPNWTNDGGATNVPWLNDDAAVFGGAGGGVVTLTGPGVSAGSLTFDVGGYVLESQDGAATLNLFGADVVTNASATINALLTGSAGLNKLGAGTLVLGSASNAFTGGVSVGAGTLVASSSANLGSAGNVVTVQGGAAFVNGAGLIANNFVLNGGTLGFATDDATYSGNVAVPVTSTVSLPVAGKTLTLSGVLSGPGGLVVDGSGGGTLVVSNANNFSGGANALAGGVTLSGGGAAQLGYQIVAQPGQTYAASGGTLSLGHSVAGATVTLLNGSSVQASGGGVVELSGRASGPGVGVVVGGELAASGGGRIVVGDGADDASQLQFVNSSSLVADGGTIELNPRNQTLAIDAGSVGALAVRNGGVLALAGGTGNLVLDRDVDQAGSWVLENRGEGTFLVGGGSQDDTSGLTLRARGGTIRYAVNTLGVGPAPANGAAAVEPRGGTVDINNASPGATFVYQPGVTVDGWGQIGSSAANQAHVIPAGGATFYATDGSAAAATLNLVGGFDESAGAKAALRIGDNDGLVLTVPNAAASPYVVNSVVIDPQSGGSVARFGAGGGVVRANGAAFVGADNRVRFDVRGGTLISDLASVMGVLETGVAGASTPIFVRDGGTFVTTASGFTLAGTDTIGGSGTLFGFNGTTTTSLFLNGALDLNGTLGASIAPGSTGTIRLDAGETLTLGAGADLSQVALNYVGGAGVASLELNAPAGATARIAATTPLGAFAGTREFKVTSGTLQMDSVAPGGVQVAGVNQLVMDRGSGPATVGTLTLNGGAFVPGAAPGTTTVTAGALLRGFGTYGQATMTAAFVNDGVVQTSTGQLTIAAARIGGAGAFDPNGQTLVLAGNVSNVAGVTQLRVAGTSGGRVQVGQANSYTGGTIVEGGGGQQVTLRVTAPGALGSGGVTLNGAQLALNSDNNLNFAGTPVTVTGSGASTINYDRLVNGSGRTHTIGTLTFGGQTLTVFGANSYRLTAGNTVVTSDATLVNFSAGDVNLGPLTLGGNLGMSLGSTNFVIGALSGAGNMSRSSASGTLVFNRPSAGWTGHFFNSVGTMNFTGSNVLGNGIQAGTYQFANASVNINAGGAGALGGGAVGSITGGTLTLNVSNALDGANITLAGGLVNAFAVDALGTGNVNITTGGTLQLRSNVGQSFLGTVNAVNTGSTNPGTLVLDRVNASGAAGATHTISALTLNGQRLNVTAPNQHRLTVTGATTAAAGNAQLHNDSVLFTTPLLQLDGNVVLSGGGAAVFGQVGGAGVFSQCNGASVTITGASAAFSGTANLYSGVTNLNVAGALAGGRVNVLGSEVNLNAANALVNAPATMSSGFLKANVPNALSNESLVVTNGTLLAAADNSLGNATIAMNGGNLTATAPNALGTAAITLNGGILALRGNAAANFGGSVALTGTNFSTISVARLDDLGTTGNALSIGSLSISGQTLNVTGADDDVLRVAGPTTMSGGVVVNATAADAVFAGGLSGSGPLAKTGLRRLTIENGASYDGATTVTAGGLVVNGPWATAGVTVGAAGSPALVEMGGGGANAPGNFVVHSGTLRASKAIVANAIPLASQISVAPGGEATVEYAGLAAGVLANNIIVDATSGTARVTLSAGSGALASQVSTFTYAGQILRGGTNALTVTARADTTQIDGLGNLSRPASRLVLGSNQSGFVDLVHGGGIVVGKGNVAAVGASPFGSGGNAVTMSRVDSTLGGMVPDGQTVATFSRSATAAASRGRLGVVHNPAGGAGVQTVNYNGTFAWNDATSPLFVAMTPGNPGAATALASWTGLFADPGTVLQFGGVGVAGGALDNVTAFANGAPSASVPVYVGGGGTVRFAANFDENTYRNAAAVRGLAGTVTVLDNTTLQSQTQGRHFDGVDVRAGTYQVSAFHQTLSGGFSAGVSLTEPTRTSGNVHVDTGLTLTLNGTGTGRTFRVGGGATLAKTGAGTLTVTGDQAHAGGSTLAVNQGTINLNTDAGANGAGAPVNNLSITAAGGQVNLAGNQHVRVVTVTGGQVRLNAGPTTGSRVIEATGVAATGGRLDLTNGRLIVDYAPGNSPIASVRAQIISGFNAAGTPWAGNGIVSSSIADASRFGVGYGEAADLLGAAGGSFGPEAVDGSAVLARYTMLGDATLDGLVDFNDLVKVAQNYNNVSGAMLWSQGDFTYDGRVDFNDLIKVAQNYNAALPSESIPFAATFEHDLASAFAAVPEPGAIGFVGVAAAAVLSRRRRR